MARRRTKRDYHIWLPLDLGAAIDVRGKASGRGTSGEVEHLIRLGLTHEASGQMEEQVLPVLRGALGADQAQMLEDLRQAIRADTEAIVKRQANRLAALTIRETRSVLKIWGFVYRLVGKQYGVAQAQAWDRDETERVGKLLTRRLTAEDRADEAEADG